MKPRNNRVISGPVKEHGTRGFFEYIKRYMPHMYERMRADMSRVNLNDAGAIAPTIDPAATASQTPMSSSLVDTIKNLANIASQAYLTREQIKSQQRILTLQLERARQGLPPLDIDPQQYGIPQPSFDVGFDSGTSKMLIIGGLVLAGALLLGLIGGGRAMRK